MLRTARTSQTRTTAAWSSSRSLTTNFSRQRSWKTTALSREALKESHQSKGGAEYAVKAIQGMLDFDYVCRRATPSVCGIIDPFGGSPRAAFYWGSKQIFITIYKSVQQAAVEHNDVSVLVNFASFRSAYNVTMETLLSSECKNIKTVAIIAEGIPEHMTRRLVRVAREKEVRMRTKRC